MHNFLFFWVLCLESESWQVWLSRCHNTSLNCTWVSASDGVNLSTATESSIFVNIWWNINLRFKRNIGEIYIDTIPSLRDASKKMIDIEEIWILILKEEQWQESSLFQKLQLQYRLELHHQDLLQVVQLQIIPNSDIEKL